MGTFHKIVYAILRFLIRPYFFLTGFRHDNFRPQSKTYLCLINHTTNWDFFMTGLTLKRHMYFVASDHIFRIPVAGGIIKFIANPIGRKKGASGAEATAEIKKRLSEGFNVCMMAEGNRTFTGETGFISPRTASLVRESGAGLVNIVIRGGYMINPRWGVKKRRGPIRAEAVREYTPEELSLMTEEEIYSHICEDLYVNAYEDQRADRAEYRVKNPAECLETALFVCPECEGVSTLESSIDTFTCRRCGRKLRINPRGFFELPDGSEPERFPTVLEWSRWQKTFLRDYLKHFKGDAASIIFSDAGLRLSRLDDAGHGGELLATGELRLYADRLEFTGDDGHEAVFSLTELSSISLALRGRLLFTVGGAYYELLGTEEYCALKYLISVRFLKGLDYIG